jgi:hypothetical protein
MIQKIEDLFARQLQAWPLLAKGIEGLSRAKMRTVRINWFDVIIRHIPHRIASTTAAVDRASVAMRSCFLCSVNLPQEEEGVQFNQDFTVYCNPFPIIDQHLTITHKEHGRQRITGQFGNMLDLAAALPGYFVIYNGPECGASAPDHMHFQAGWRKLLPIERDTTGLSTLTVPNYGRNVFLFRGKDRSALIGRMDRVIALLAETTGKRAEPLVNIAVFHELGEWVAYLFPRGKHRPHSYETGELTVSPASIDMCGIFVVPLAEDFEKIRADDIAEIFQEVTLPDAQFHEVARTLENEY